MDIVHAAAVYIIHFIYISFACHIHVIYNVFSTCPAQTSSAVTLMVCVMNGKEERMRIETKQQQNLDALWMSFWWWWWWWLLF